MACQEADDDSDIGTPRALVSYNNDNITYCDDDNEEMIAEHHETKNEDGDNENAVQLFDDYLTEFDDIPHEVDFVFNYEMIIKRTVFYYFIHHTKFLYFESCFLFIYSQNPTHFPDLMTITGFFMLSIFF